MAIGTFGFAEVPFVLNEIHIATLDQATAAYTGDIVSAAGPQRLGFTGETHNPELEIAGLTERYGTLLRRYSVSLELAGVDIQFHKVLTGGTEETSGSPETHRNFFIPIGGNAGLPFVGMIGLGYTDDGGAFAIGTPRFKLSNVPGFDLTGNTVEYSSASLDGMALPFRIRGVGTPRYACIIRLYEDEADFVVPAMVADFKTFFTDDLP